MLYHEGRRLKGMRVWHEGGETQAPGQVTRQPHAVLVGAVQGASFGQIAATPTPATLQNACTRWRRLCRP